MGREDMTNSQALRIIGQELENHQVFDFTITREDDAFSVEGKKKAVPRQEKTEPQSLWKRLFQQPEEPVRKPPDAESVQLHFTVEDLAQLDRRAGAQRPSTRNLPDDYSTSNILRVVGAFVDQFQGTVTRLVKEGGGLVIEYEKPGVGLQVEERLISTFYDFSTRLVRGRQD
jgi:hypothetical protein